MRNYGLSCDLLICLFLVPLPSRLFLIGEISPRREFQISEMKKFWMFSIAKSEGEHNKISIYGFQCVAKNIEG
jgi:hypothetical protein